MVLLRLRPSSDSSCPAATFPAAACKGPMIPPCTSLGMVRPAAALFLLLHIMGSSFSTITAQLQLLHTCLAAADAAFKLLQYRGARQAESVLVCLTLSRHPECLLACKRRLKLHELLSQSGLT